MNVHVITGEDDFRVGEAAKKIVGDGVGLEVVDSANSSNADQQLADVRAAEESLSTPPFLDPRKVTWWKNVHFLPGGRASEEVKEALEKFAKRLASAQLPDNQHFILSGPHLLKTSVFAKTLASAAEMVVFAAEKPWEAARSAVVRAIDFAADAGLKFAPGAAERLVATVGPDSRSIFNEVSKLRDYLGGERAVVESADIDAISSAGAGVEPEVWSVTDAVGRRDLAAVLAALPRFDRGNGFAVLISGVVEKFFRQLLDLAAGRETGMAPFAVRKNQAFLRNWTVPELRTARYRFLMLREKAVSGTACADTLVSIELARTVRRPRR